MTPEEINNEFRMIISHALMGNDDNISKEDWDLVFSECTKFAYSLSQSTIQELCGVLEGSYQWTDSRYHHVIKEALSKYKP